MVNVIASDKTGTLTQNKMFVARAAAGLDELTVVELDAQTATPSRAWLQLIASSGLCNNAKFDDDKPMANQKSDATTVDVKVDVKQRKANGDATDIALLKFATEYGRMDEREQNYTVLSEIPFNSKNKWMMKICRSPDGLFKEEGAATAATGECDDVVLLKGAPDYLLKKSASIVNSDGTARKLATADVNAIIKLQNEWCMLGQRVLIICKKMCNFAQLGSRCGTIAQLENYINESNDFCIVGLVGIIDPPRFV